MRCNKILLLFLAFIILASAGCKKESSLSSFYVANVWKVEVDGKLVARMIMIQNTGSPVLKEITSDNPRIQVDFPVESIDSIKKGSYYFPEDLLPLGIVIPNEVLPKQISNQGAVPAAVVTDNYTFKLKDKFIIGKNLYLYFEETIAEAAETYTDGRQTLSKKSSVVSRRLVTTDPDIYASFEIGKRYPSDKPPLAIIKDKLETPNPMVERPDKEE